MKEDSQAHRIAAALDLVGSVWKEIAEGKIERSILQDAVYLQQDVNRIVWKLNEMNNRGNRQ